MNFNQFVIAKSNIASFYRLLERYDLAFETYQEIECELFRKLFILAVSETNCFKFQAEKELRQINPLSPEKIESAFMKQLGKSKLTVLKCKQWLLWSKTICIKKLNIPLLLPVTFQSYINFLTLYQKHTETPNINATLMLYQTFNLIKPELQEIFNTVDQLSKLQQQILYSSLSRFIFSERECFHKIVCLLYEIKPLNLRERYDVYFKLLEDLSVMAVPKFRAAIEESQKSKVYLIKRKDLLEKIEYKKYRNRLKKMAKVIEYDDELQSLLGEYSKYTLTKTMFNCTPMINLRWLIFNDPATICKMNESNPMWGVLFEYTEIQKLLVNILSTGKEEIAFDIALNLCEYFLKGQIASHRGYSNGRKNVRLGMLFWNIVLTIGKELDKKKVDVSRIFDIREKEEDNIPHIILVNPFDDFNIDEIFVDSRRGRILFNKEVLKLSKGENSFTQVHYKEPSSATLNFVIGKVEFCVTIPYLILMDLTRQMTLRLFRPEQLRFDKNLIIFSIEPSYYIENTILSIETDLNSSIVEDVARICKNNKEDNKCKIIKEASITHTDNIYNIALPALKGPKESAYVALILSFNRDKSEPEAISFVASLVQNNTKVFQRSFTVHLPKNMIVNVHVSHYNNSRLIQTEIDTVQRIKIVELDVNVEGVDKGMLWTNSRFGYDNA